MNYNPAKSVYINPNIQYMFNTAITEFDLKDGGFSLIKQYKLLPESEISRLSGVEKGFNRHREIGLLQRDNKELSKALSEKFAEIRNIFIMANNINDNDIISVKKDAFFLIGDVKNTKFGLLEFRKKNTYSSYIRFENNHNIELYYSSDGIDIKGMGENSVNKHRLYMLDFLKTVISSIESKSPNIKRKIMRFIDSYKSMELDDPYYLEFNNMSKDINPIFNYQKIIIPLVQIVIKEVF